MLSVVVALPALLAACVSMPVAVYPDHILPPTVATVTHTPATSQTFSLAAHGSITASVVSTSCRGYVAEAPDLSVDNSTFAGIIPLNIIVTGSGDATLLVRAPDGTWLCDDDSGGRLNPAIRINRPINGQYDIWVGVFSPDSLIDSTLRVF